MKKAIIVDLDGTLALSQGRDFYDASECETDLPNESLVEIMKRISYDSDSFDFNSEELFIIICSGRFDTYKPQTERWLAKHNIKYDELYMRKARDMRSDQIVKQEILFEQILPNDYEVFCVFDDRPKVCDMWRAHGFTVFNCGDGKEF